MRWLKKNPRLQGFLSAILLTACAGATGIGAGCSAYAEARLSMPSDEVLLAAPEPLVRWITVDLDARMTAVCKR